MAYDPTTTDLHKTVRPAYMPASSDGDVQAAIDLTVAGAAQAVSDAQDAQAAAEAAQAAAETAQGLAETAQTGAETAQGLAETAEAGAEAAAAAAVAEELPTRTAGSAAGAVALRFGASATEGLEITVIDEVVDMLTTPAAAWDLTSDIPAGAVILSVQANLQDVISAVTAVKVGIGVVSDPDKYGKTANLLQNSKVNTIPDWAVLSGTEDIQIYAVDTDGAAAGTIGGGATGTDEVRVRIVYATLNSLDNAA